jgi:hypothetical protein
MNYQLAVVGGLTVFALLAHVFGGIRESLSVEPAKLTDREKNANFETLERHWVQSICAFQLVTVDLLVLSVLLFLLAFTDVLLQKQLIGFALAAFYFLWGCAWLVQIFILKRKAKDYLLLGHWIFWFGCSALIYWGSLSL